MMNNVSNYVVTVLITMILTTIYIVNVEDDARKDYAKTGYIVIDHQAYRIVPAEK
jgi:hypothetical protein